MAWEEEGGGAGCLIDDLVSRPSRGPVVAFTTSLLLWGYSRTLTLELHSVFCDDHECGPNENRWQHRRQEPELGGTGRLSVSGG